MAEVTDARVSDQDRAKAASLLGTDDVEGQEDAGPATIMMMIDGGGRRQSVRLETGVAVGRIAGQAAGLVGVSPLRWVAFRGQAVPPSATLADLGARAGDVLTVGGPGDEPPAVDPDDRPDGTGSRVSSLPDFRRSVRPRRLPTIAGCAALAAVCAAAGAGVGVAVSGGSGSHTTSVAAGVRAQMTRTARQWANSQHYSARLMRGVAALGVQGAKFSGSVVPIRWSSAGAYTTGTFLVTLPAGTVALTVVDYDGQLAYPPSVTGAQPVTVLAPGGPKAIPERGRVTSVSLRAEAAAWARSTFAHPQGGLNLTETGKAGATEIAQWRSGAYTVARVEVALQASVTSPTATLAAAKGAATAAAYTGIVKQLEASVAASGKAAQSAAGVKVPRGAAGRSQRLAAAKAEGAAAMASQLEQTVSRQAPKLPAVPAPAVSKFASVYDVVFVGSRPVAWGPAGYGIGGKQ